MAIIQKGQIKEVMEITPEIIKGKVCPYCMRKSKYVNSSVIYGKSYGMVYYCQQCDAYVGVHKGTTKALGRLANKELRIWKKEAHKWFDPLWKKKMEIDGFTKYQARNAAYEWLARELGIEERYCHIGMFDIEYCKKVVKLCQPHYKKSKA